MITLLILIVCFSLIGGVLKFAVKLTWGLTKLLIGLGVDEETASEDACRIEHYISDKTFDAFTHKGKYASYTNTFVRDFYDVLIKGSKHEDWFAPKS